VWVGGLVALVILGGPVWRRLDPVHRPRLVREAARRFTRVAIVAVAVVVATGVINSIENLASVDDLWTTSYGRAISAKVALLVVALVLAFRHRRVPRRVEDAPDAVVRSFNRTSVIEAVVLMVAVAVAAVLVVLVPGRSLELAANGPVNTSETATGGYVVQLFIDPSGPGRNDVHLTYVSPSGLGAAEVTNATAALALDNGAAAPLQLRLIAAGHFVAETDMVAGHYQLTSEGRGAPSPLTATFNFDIKENP
jgi:copper transport protein